MKTASKMAHEVSRTGFFVLLLFGVMAYAGRAWPQPTAAAELASGPAASPTDLLTTLYHRGLMGAVPAAMPTPPAGVEVDEYVQKLSDTGEVIENGMGWDEPFGADLLRIQTSILANHNTQIQFWVLPLRGPGCLLFGLRQFDQQGHELQNVLWKNDPGLEPPRAQGYRAVMYPNAAIGGVPANAFMRALSVPEVGGSGDLFTLITPYEVVRLNVWAEGQEAVTVPAGSFQALKVVMRTDIKSFVPSLPGFLASMMETFLPKNIFYFEPGPPYRLVRFDGVSDQNAPRTTIELMGYHTARTTAAAPSAPPETASSR